MQRLFNFKLLAAFLLSLWVMPIYASSKTPETVIGRQLMIDGGSSIRHHIMPIVLRAFDRNRVVLGYISYISSASESGTVYGNMTTGETMLGNLEMPVSVEIDYIMIHCDKQTYAHYPDNTISNTDLKIFYNGDSFKWGEYESSENGLSTHLMRASWGKEEITRLFHDACNEA